VATGERDQRVGEVALQVMRVVEEIDERWGEVLLRAGLTGSQLTLLRRLVVEGPTTMREVARHLACDPSLAAVAVDRLEGRGLVARLPDEPDHRVRIAPGGSRLVADVWAEMAARTAVGRLDDAQLTQLADLLAAMVRERG
jgi:DNA-binding MarR family transcriptional regulator